MRRFRLIHRPGQLGQACSRYALGVPTAPTSRSFQAVSSVLVDARADGRFIDDYLAYLLSQASRRVSGDFHAEVQADGLSVTEWRILASLTGVPNESIGALSEITVTKQPTLSKIIQRMERQGLVARGGTAADRRQTLVSLTSEGQALAAAYVQRALQHQGRVLQPLGTRNARTLIRVLRQLIDLPDPG